MPLSDEKTMEMIVELAKKNEYQRKIRAVVYREDYQDYIIVVGAKFYADIREKLITDYHKLQHEDAAREIMYKLNHPLELDEFQMAEMGISEEEIDDDQLASHTGKDGKGSEKKEADDDFKKKIAVDDSDKYDWID